jgi:hypothetical protein
MMSKNILNRHKRAHTPQLAAGYASESKIGKIPYREDSLQLAAGYSSITAVYCQIRNEDEILYQTGR